MNRFHKILCYAEPLSQARTALKRAIQLARAGQASLTLASVVDEIPILAMGIQESFVDIRRDELLDLLEEQDCDDVNTNIQVLTGGLGADHVIRAVIEQGHDLVIKPTDNAGRGTRILFGSHDQNLLRKCPVPVWIVKPQHNMHRILAAIDVDPEQQENENLNRAIMDLATGLAAQYDAQLHIVHAWHMYAEETLRNARSRLSRNYLDDVLLAIHDQHRKWLEAFLQTSDLKNLDYTLHMEKGDAATVISELIGKLGVDLAVMGTLARTGFPGFFIGNTAEKILTAIDCSVLTVKPASFQSPLSD